MTKGFKREPTRNAYNMWFMCEKDNSVIIQANTPSGFNLKLRLHKKKCKECNNVKWSCENISKKQYSDIQKNHNIYIRKNNISQDSYELTETIL